MGLGARLPGIPEAARWRLDGPGGATRFLKLSRAPAERPTFDFRLDAALERARRRLDEGRIVPERDVHPEHAHLSATEALDRLHEERPDSEDPVVCHGDCCPPNVLILEGRVRGSVDLGELGVADRTRDLAVAT